MPPGDLLSGSFRGRSDVTFGDVINGALMGGPDGDLLAEDTLSHDKISGKVLLEIQENFLPSNERYYGPVSWSFLKRLEALKDQVDYGRRVQRGQQPDPHLCRRCRRLCLVRNGSFTGNPTIRSRPFGTWYQLLLRPHCRICRLIVLAASCGTTRLHPHFSAIQPEVQFVQLRPKSLASGEQTLAMEFGLRRIGLLRIITEGNFREILRQAFEVPIGCTSPFDLIASPASVFNSWNGQTASIQMIKNWIHLCDTTHGSLCRNIWRHLPNGRPLFTLLVDVFDQCLVMKSIIEEAYFTLSYVWGSVGIPKTNKDNLRARLVRGSLNCHLPATIADAIVLVRNLGTRYLWVDSLCIVQDDEHSKHGEIQAMDMIYSHSVATIIALYGSDADAGLSGVLPGTREPQRIECLTSMNQQFPGPTAREIQALDRLARDHPEKHRQYLSSGRVATNLNDSRIVFDRLINENADEDLLPPEAHPVHADRGMVAHPPSLKHLLSMSVWNSRSWTLQERLLSRRCIFFAEHNVYFQCGQTTWCETGGNLHTWADVGDDDPLPRNNDNDSIAELPQKETNPLLQFRRPAPMQSVSYQTSDGSAILQRQDIDIYMSVITTYSQRKLTFASDVMYALAGILSVAQERLGGQMLAGLPSPYLDLAMMWTPAEAMDRTGPVGQGGNAFPTWSWSAWTGGKQYRLAESGRASFHSLDHEYATSEISRFYMFHYGEATEVSKSAEDMLATELRNFGRMYGENYEQRLHPKYIRYTDRSTSHVQGPDFGPNVLQFRAQTVPQSAFRLQNGRDTLITDPDHGNISGKTSVTPILDQNGKQCGLMFLPHSKTDYRRGIVGCRMDFVLISSFRDTRNRRGGIQTMDTTLKPFDEKAFPWKGKNSGLCNVMLIEWFDDIAERLSVAQIHRVAWEAARPVLQHVRLS